MDFVEAGDSTWTDWTDELGLEGRLEVVVGEEFEVVSGVLQAARVAIETPANRNLTNNGCIGFNGFILINLRNYEQNDDLSLGIS